jgi:hypothetical protein
VLFCCNSDVNLRFECEALKSARMECMLVQLGSKVMRMSSTYLW